MPTFSNKRMSELMSKGQKGSEQLVSNYARNLIASYKSALKDIQSEIADMFAKYGQNVLYSDMQKFNRLTNMEKQIADIIKQTNGEVIKTTTQELKDLYSQSYYYAGFAMESQIGVRLGFGLLREGDVKACLLNPLDHIKWTVRQAEHSKSLLSQIRGELTQGILKGSGYNKIAKNIERKTKIAADKSLLIAQTEGHRVMQMGRLDAMDTAETAADNMGMTIKKVWIATLDDKTRDDHAEMDGQIADADGMFYFPDGTPTEAPGMSGIPEQDINCRCVVQQEIEGFEPQERKDNISKELIPNMTYNEWYALRIE
jgi:uncharacterized protein with gpF-like domain